MSRKNTAANSRVNFFAILIISLLISLLLSTMFNMLATLYINHTTYSLKSLVTFVTYLLAILLSIVFVLLGVLISRISKDRHQENELMNFKDYTEALHQSSSELEVYEILFKYTSKMPFAKQVTLFYPNEKSKDSEPWNRISNERLPLCEMHFKECPIIKSQKDCSVPSIGKDIVCAYQLREYTFGSYLCLPVIDSGDIQCILQVYNNNDYTFDETANSKIKSYIEIAKPILNSRKTVNMLNKKASTDKLTKLYNRGYLDPFLENQLEIASQSKRQLSIILIDIDHFKKVNDTYGHSAGDHILVLFADILLKCVRKSDLVARYGGEEFIAVLPSTGIEMARQIAERIRLTVSHTYIPPLEGVNIPSVNCSLGISTYPIHCNSKAALVKAADTALYKAKQSGRNCTVVYQVENK